MRTKKRGEETDIHCIVQRLPQPGLEVEIGVKFWTARDAQWPLRAASKKAGVCGVGCAVWRERVYTFTFEGAF